MCSRTCLIAAVGGVLIVGLAARATEPAPVQLQQDIANLQSQVSQLQALEARNQKESAATVDAILRDAERRSQLLANGDSSAGYDNGFYIRSGDFLMRPGVMMQFRNVTDYRQNTVGGKSDEMENGFEVRRMEFHLEGTAFTQDLRYNIFWSTDRNTGDLYLDEAWGRYMVSDAWGVRFGQFKQFWSHEEYVTNGRPMAVERSLVDAAFGSGFSDFVQGVTMIYGGRQKDMPFFAEVGLTDGASSKDTDYTGHSPADPVTLPPFGFNTASVARHGFDFGAVARAEWKAMGDWTDYNHYSAAGQKTELLVLGAGAEWNQGGDGDEVAGTVDLQFKHSCGAGIYAGLIVRNMNGEISALAQSQTDWGGVLQVSYAVNPVWEPFARYAYVKFDDKIQPVDESAFHEICVGVNYYLGTNGSAGQSAKITVDVDWLPNGAPGAVLGQGYLGDSRGSNEVALRGQFTLAL